MSKVCRLLQRHRFISLYISTTTPGPAEVPRCRGTHPGRFSSRRVLERVADIYSKGIYSNLRFAFCVLLQKLKTVAQRTTYKRQKNSNLKLFIYVIGLRSSYWELSFNTSRAPARADVQRRHRKHSRPDSDSVCVLTTPRVLTAFCKEVSQVRQRRRRRHRRRRRRP